MQVAADEGHPVLTNQGSDPKVVARYRMSARFHFVPNPGIALRRARIDCQDGANLRQFRKPSFVRLPVPRAQNAEPVLAQYDGWKEDPNGLLENRFQKLISVGHG